MKKEYKAPEFITKRVSFLDEVLTVSSPEVTTPSQIATLPRDGEDW